MRPGHSLLEVVAALSAGALLTTLVAATVVAQAKAAGAVARNAEVAEAVALATAVLGAELRDGSNEDRTVGADSIALRAFRATAIVCDTSDGHAVLRWSGSRGPDATKDSLLLLRAAGVHVLPLRTPVALDAAGCQPRPSERLYRVESLGELRPADIVLGFERGSYHLSDRALRWRVGAAGRQPLTAEVFDDAGSGFEGGGRVLLHLRSRGTSARDPVRTWHAPLRALDGG